MADEDGVGMTVNGRDVAVTGDPERPLVLALRNDLGLRGVRVGCAIGECGACTVIAGGRPIRSCITPVSEVAGGSITTPEGLGTPDAPHPVQQAFLDEQAAQCGYCINGMVMTVAALRDSGPEAERRINEALRDHLCRCGAHVRILRAVRRALGEVEPDGSAAECAPPPPDCSSACAAERIPPALARAPSVEAWLTLLDDGRVEARSGKVELGQGLRTALAQIVAAHLGLPVERVVVRSAATDGTPDERYTAGTRSIEEGGAALASAATALRRLLLARGAARLGRASTELVLDERGVSADGCVLVPWHDLIADGPVTGPIEATDRPHWHGGPIGVPVAREDLLSKLTGAAAFVHDLHLPGMVHARAVLPPSYDAGLVDVDVDAVQAMPGVRAVLRDGRLLVVIADREEQARNAVTRLRRTAVWEGPGLDVGRDLEGMLRSLPAETLTVRDDPGAEYALSGGGRTLRATYGCPYQAHAPIAPSCAVALADGGVLTVWTHSQGVYPLRQELAGMLEVDESLLVVRHVDGPGCYGHNAADDAAAFAALAARALPGVPVRFQFSVEDEFTWEPYGSAMLADLEGALDERGCIVGWRHRSRTDVHAARPAGSGDRLVPSWLVAQPRARPWTGPRDTGTHDVVPLYEIPAVAAATDFVRGPLRTSALRSLASFHNVFAAESFVDELAEAAGRDPVAFRIAHLGDVRARRVLQTAADAAGWTPRVGPSGRGRGVAVCRYKGSKAYVAAVADAAVDPDTGQVSVSSVVLACDAGTVINPDGLRNQLEGGTIQALSRALREEVRVAAGAVVSRDWTSYPVLRFGEVPRIAVHLTAGEGSPPLGAGEAAGPPVVAALANAIDDAIGVRVRTLPFTPARLERRLLDLTAEEARRCLL